MAHSESNAPVISPVGMFGHSFVGCQQWSD